MTDITMPRLSDSMQEGTILSWLKQSGEPVQIGDELVEIETDKATMTYESPNAGILEILASEGATLVVGEPIARLGVGTPEDAPAATPAAQNEPAPQNEPGTSTVPRAPRNAPGTRTVPRALQPAAPTAGTTANASGGDGAAVRATPLARRLAADRKIDLAGVSGSGPRGRVTRADVAAAAAITLPPPVFAAVAADSREGSTPRVAPPSGDGTTGAEDQSTLRPLTRVQALIARRMAQTKATVPDFQVQTEVTMNLLLGLRTELKAATDRPPSVNDFIVKAAALALREFPVANGSYKDGSFELHSRINIGVAVAADGALIVPTVTDADSRSIGGIASEVRRLAAAVRQGTVTPSELSGATFTVSNLGMYGMTAITPVINAPQAAILGVGATRTVLARVDGEIVDREMMTLTLSCDHRILYGAEASQFLFRIRELLEQPLLLAF